VRASAMHRTAVPVLTYLGMASRPFTTFRGMSYISDSIASACGPSCNNT
jgi:hypothetical protein